MRVIPTMCVKRTSSSSTMCAPGYGASDGQSQNSDMAQPMHTYLRAWRKNRKLTLADVAERLSVRHTTVSRWELGQMKISTADLERLATVYDATVTQIVSPPKAATLVNNLDRFQAIIDGMSADQVDRILTFLESSHTPLK